MGDTDIQWPMPPDSRKLAVWAQTVGYERGLDADLDGKGARFGFNKLLDLELNKKEASSYQHLLTQGVPTELKIVFDAFQMFRLRNFTNVAFTLPQHSILTGSNKSMVQLALYEGAYWLQ